MPECSRYWGLLLGENDSITQLMEAVSESSNFYRWTLNADDDNCYGDVIYVTLSNLFGFKVNFLSC